MVVHPSEPVDIGQMTGFADLAAAATAARDLSPQVPLALATLVQVEGSSYRQPGARLLVDAEGRVAGFHLGAPGPAASPPGDSRATPAAPPVGAGHARDIPVGAGHARDMPASGPRPQG